MAKPKFQLLHVRVTADQYEKLQQVVATRPGSKMSEVVREAIGLITRPVAVQTAPVAYTVATYDALANMATELNRSPAKVAEDCVLAVYDSITHHRVPLIVEELKLRQQYKRQEAGE